MATKKSGSTARISPQKSTRPAAPKIADKDRPKRRRRESVPEEEDICFVMSPFGGWYDQYHTAIYCPAIEAAGLTPRRADDLYRPSAIVQDIWSYVRDAKVMLADLTDKNPNVFYELGLAHALSKPVVLLTQAIDDVPFDLRALRVINYDTAAPEWAETLRTSISAALTEALKAPATAVLQPFQPKTQPSVSTAENKRDALVQQLMREVNVLRSEIVGRPPRREIEPREARVLIERYVDQGMPESMIIDRVAPLGPPPSWIVEQIDRRSRRSRVRPSERALEQ